ncbi:chromosome partitioning protein [Nostoc sp. T09]|uniref:ParA family protein n=1 Tax=Nostoc sp. T09 TaxID=1932621 RepID=UPI000A3BD531|nr:ParA family protein [Nostoc sp. T09]OUL37568.1 chromosome partitioning protein [Nostoc sp. T09]
MSTTIIAFFNNKGGVGKTSLVYHLAWMYSDLGYRVVAADLDPQANLTTAFLDEERLEEIWLEKHHQKTIFGCVEPLIKGIDDIAEPHLEYIANYDLSANKLALLAGDLLLTSFESYLSSRWHELQSRKTLSLQYLSAFWRILQKASIGNKADIILMDLSPNLGAINHAALIAADYVVIPLLLDISPLYGLRNLAQTLTRWREGWKTILANNITDAEPLPAGIIQPIGYVVCQLPMRLDRPAKAYHLLMSEIPKVYREAMLNDREDENISLQDDPNCLALLKSYQSLMSMAQEAHKPMFHLKPADGAIGAHTRAVKNVYEDFEKLARKIAERTQLKTF